MGPQWSRSASGTYNNRPSSRLFPTFLARSRYWLPRRFLIKTATMNKNFLRTLRMAFRYRFTLVGATLTALGVAVLWGGNIGAVFPFVKVVLEGKTIQAWVAEEIDRSGQAINEFDKQIAAAQADVAAAPAERQPKLEAAVRSLQSRRGNEQLARDWYVRAKPHLERWPPTSRSRSRSG